MRGWEIIKNFIISQKAGKANYLCREIAAYVSSGEEVKGNNVEDKRKTNENRIVYLVGWLSGDIRDNSNTVSQTRRVGNWYWEWPAMSYSNRKRVHIQKHIFNTTIYLVGTYDSLCAKDSKRRQVFYHQEWGYWCCFILFCECCNITARVKAFLSFIHKKYKGHHPLRQWA